VTQHKRDENIDQGVIDSFGHEWATFDYGETETAEALNAQFDAYCAPIDLSNFDPKNSIAADFGAGSGRWAARLVPYISLVYALEQSDGASKVLQNKFSDESKIVELQETVGANSISLQSLDLAISLECCIIFQTQAWRLRMFHSGSNPAACSCVICITTWKTNHFSTN
jgi:hypothetical protein